MTLCRLERPKSIQTGRFCLTEFCSKKYLYAFVAECEEEKKTRARQLNTPNF